MTTLATLERRAAALLQEAHSRYPDRVPVTLDHLSEQERAGLEAFNERMQAQGKIHPEQLTDDELDEALHWSSLVHRKKGYER